MNKIIFTLAFWFIFTSSVFAQTTADDWFEKASEYSDKGDYANAITACNEAIKRDSTYLDAYWIRGIAYHNTKNYNAAISDYTKVIAGSPNFHYAYYYRGDAYNLVKNYDAAIADFNKAISLKPDFSTAYVVRGYAYGAKGLYHKAIADYKTGLEKGYDPSGWIVDKSDNADMWFCGAMYMEIAVNRFLGKSDVVAKYENWLKTVSDKNKVSRAEIEKFYRDNVRSLIAAVVDEEFNKVSFVIENFSANSKIAYNAILNRYPQNGQYTLSYERPSVDNDDKTLTAPSLEALSSTMRNSGDFVPDAINTVRAQAALIPAVVYADWKTKGVAGGVDGMALIKEAWTNFYLDPKDNTYLAVYGIQLRYKALLDTALTRRDEDIFADVALQSYKNLFRSLNPELEGKFYGERRYYTSDAVRVPNDPRFNIFSTPYTAR